METRAILFSIKPDLCSRILAGEKSVEFRRRCPRVKPGDIVFLYATAPVQCVVGVAAVEEVTSGSVETIWRAAGSRGGITKAAFREYFAGRITAHAIGIRAAKRLTKPLNLADLERRIPGFRPPQSYRFVVARDLGC